MNVNLLERINVKLLIIVPYPFEIDSEETD